MGLSKKRLYYSHPLTEKQIDKIEGRRQEKITTYKGILNDDNLHYLHTNARSMLKAYETMTPQQILRMENKLSQISRNEIMEFLKRYGELLDNPLYSDKIRFATA